VLGPTNREERISRNVLTTAAMQFLSAELNKISSCLNSDHGQRSGRVLQVGAFA
jgi:hypothetical protein